MLWQFPPSVRAFLREHAEVIWDSFVDWSSRLIEELRGISPDQFSRDDDWVISEFIKENVPLRSFFDSGLRTDALTVDHEIFFGAITQVREPDIAGGTLLVPHVVGEVRGVGQEYMTEAQGWEFHQGLIRVSAEAYEHELLVSAQQRYANSQGWSRPTGRPSGVFRYPSGDDGVRPDLYDELHRVALEQERPIVVVSARPDSAGDVLAREGIDQPVVNWLTALLREQPALATSALFVVAGFHPAVHELRRQHRLSMVYPLKAAKAEYFEREYFESESESEHSESEYSGSEHSELEPGGALVPLVVSDTAGRGPFVAGIGWRLVTPDNEVDDSL
ncbi:hypothetical protein AB0J84_32290, partial [Micromonospora arborensis]|uniref:hypothetical protein n=1 Tax=Micromonospora arborensis TaxID=2116518 RepID=UPI00343EF4A8